MRMLTVTWTNDARDRLVFWLHAAVRHGIWPSVDDQLGITPRASQILLATFSRPKTAFPQLISPFQATRRRNLRLGSASRRPARAARTRRRSAGESARR